MTNNHHQHDDRYSGMFTRESFTLQRNQSICSVHGVNKRTLSRLNSFDRVSVITCYTNEKKVTDDSFGRRFNSSFHHFRYIIAILGGLAVGFMSVLRLNITVAILNMVNQTQIYLEENPEADLDAYFGEGYNEVGEFEWTNEKQQLIISYYMIAYTLPQLLTTKLAIKMGVRWSIPLSVAICAFSCLLTPIMAYQGWEYVTILRLLNGLGASAILPVMVYVIEQWMPARESSLGLAIVLFVQSVLFTLSPLVSGLLADIHWKWTFYVPAIVSLIFCLVWFLVVKDQPSECWFVSQTELDTICGCDQIEQRLNSDRMRAHDHSKGCRSNNTSSEISSSSSSSSSPSKFNDQSRREQQPQQDIPWTKALKVKSFYAVTAVWIFYQSSFGSFSFLIPSYMRQVLKVPIMENGMLCFIIQCGCMVSVIWPQPVLGVLQNRFKLSITASRRVVMAIICFVAVSTMLIVARYHEHQVILFALNRIFHLSMDTMVTSTIMSQYGKAGISSIVYSVINAIGNFSTVFFCMAVGEFLDISGQSVECWSWVLVSMSLMNVAILILYSTVITSEPINFDNLVSSDCTVLDAESCNKINYYLESNEHYVNSTTGTNNSSSSSSDINSKKVVDVL